MLRGQWRRHATKSGIKAALHDKDRTKTKTALAGAAGEKGLTQMQDTKITLGNQADIKRTLAFFHGGGTVFEIRGLGPKRPTSKLWEGYAGGNKGTVSGYFDNLDIAAKAVADLDAVGFQGLYVTLNPVSPDLLARANNRLRAAQKGESTSDVDILSLRWVLFDMDPIRASGISSSDEEHQAALTFCKRVKADLSADGWPDPLFADSGNGAHLLYAVDLQNAPEGKNLIKNVLAGLLRRYANHAIVVEGKEHPCVRWNDVNIEIDQTVHNASRISKIYGTWARKGDRIPDRPHRLARIIELPSKDGGTAND